MHESKPEKSKYKNLGQKAFMTPFNGWGSNVARLQSLSEKTRSLFLPLMMMMMMMMMNSFCRMVEQKKVLSLISSRDHCQRFSPSQILDMPQAGFEPVRNMSSGFVEENCAVVITTKPRSHH